MNNAHPGSNAKDSNNESSKAADARWQERAREWRSRLAVLVAGFLLFSVLSGLAIWLLPFSVPNQWSVVVHTLAGLAFLIPCGWYLLRHWRRYWRDPLSHIQLLGYVAAAAVLLCLVSGLMLTWESVYGIRINYSWDLVHIITTFATLAFGLPHLILIVVRDRKAALHGAGAEQARAAAHYGKGALVWTLAGAAIVALAAYAYHGPKLQRDFPADYTYPFGKNRPFAPSLARTASDRAMDVRLLSGSRSCGTSGCHEQIVKEWEPSAHRYAAMDTGFQAIQMNMAKQNGPESTRYCGGCHDPISLFSGTKNLFIAEKELTSLHGFQEGVSCLGCHAVRQVDVKGNANYSVAQPVRYLFEMEYDEKPTEFKRVMRDFLIRSYPRQHVQGLSKRLFKTPEYCAGCHKQFIDKEINNVGWVQLQNQYDNWRQSHWNKPGDPRKTIECRECHMPLVDSRDPAAGDSTDYNRSPNDQKHRSHRFIAANQLMPSLLDLPGHEKQAQLTEQWLKGEFPIPEIEQKWRRGPAVALEMIAPERAKPGETLNVKLVITSNKVGHDFPTGPLDIIQSWVEFVVKDETGKVIYETGTVNDRGFIKPGTFMFKAEPVDQYGNLIDRHNLWEMVGVRHRRALFPGFSDTTEFAFYCPSLVEVKRAPLPHEMSVPVSAPAGTHALRIQARLRYRKIDQFLLNFMFGEEKHLTSPITDIATQERVIEISGPERRLGG
ncbi:MAG: multiheme c-type cytochrome [Terriglobia bacterium]